MAEVVYSIQQIEDWQTQLQAFAKTPRTRFSKRQAVEAMIEDIEAALLSHPYEEVAEKLKDWGLDIAAGSLKQYVTAYRRAQADETGGTACKRSGKKSQKKSKKKSAGKAAGRSHRTTENASPDGDVNSTVNTAADASDNPTNDRTENRTTRTSNRTPDGFLEMAEDL